MSAMVRKLTEPVIYDLGKKMGYSDKEIAQFQLKRLGLSFLCVCLGLVLFSMTGVLGVIFFSSVGLLLWVEKRKRVVQHYKAFSFVRQVSFSKFCRMLIPYLLLETQTKSLYGIFHQLAQRMANDPLQEPLYQLLADLNDHPNEIDPFLRFATACSGTDEAINFMTTLYYYQQRSEDPTLIQELARLANDELFQGVQTIIDVKVRRLSKYPMFLVFSLGIPLLGMMAAFVLQLVQANLLVK